MKINFFNQTDIDTKEYQKLIQKTLKKQKKKVTFNIIFVTPEEIKRLNIEYRHKDYVTDVISFALNDNNESSFNILDDELGDIFICLEKAFEQAKEYEHSNIREVVFLAVHGFLHLIGYDHQTIEEEQVMIKLQNEILNKANIRR